MYHKILDEAVQELKDTEFKDLFTKDLVKEAAKIVAQDCTIETDLEILIPETYVSNIAERLSLYSKLDSIKDEEALAKFVVSIKDRFGPMPEPVEDLVETVRLRWLAEYLGFEKVTLKGEAMKCYFMPSGNEAYFQSEVFGRVITFVQKRPRQFKMKEYKKRLILRIEEINSVEAAISLLSQMKE